MNKSFHPTLCNGCSFLSMLGLMLVRYQWKGPLVANELRNLKGGLYHNHLTDTFDEIYISFILDRCMYVCVYVFESASERTLGYLYWFHSFVTRVVPGNHSFINHNNSDQYLTYILLSVCALLCFSLVYAAVFLTEILRDYFIVSVYSQYFPDTCREAMMNVSK